MPPLDEDEKQSHKTRFSLAHLPFPGGSSVYLVIWQKTYVPSLISWAGSLEDPFGTNFQMEDQVMELWMQIYPSLPLVKASQDHDIVLTVMC